MLQKGLELNCLLQEKEYGYNLVITVENTTEEEIAFMTPTQQLVTVRVVDSADNVRWYPQVGYKEDEQRWDVPPDFPLVKSFRIRTPEVEKEEVTRMESEYDTSEINTSDIVTDPRDVAPEEHADVFISPAIPEEEFDELYVTVEVQSESVNINRKFSMTEIME